MIRPTTDTDLSNDQAWEIALSGDTKTSQAWQLFHENAKVSRQSTPVNNETVRHRMLNVPPSLSYKGYPIYSLPDPEEAEFALSLRDTLTQRQTARSMESSALTPEQLSALLAYSYGETRDETASGFPRPFRVVPSGGAMYPLEIYFHASNINSLPAGLYHYHAGEHQIRLVQRGDLTRQLSEAMVQNNLALEASLLVFITALFERSVFKYQERGYRFALLEAGHVAQNMNLVAHGLELGITNIGGYFDREIDELLNLDGLEHSCIYMQAIGGNREDESRG